MDRAVIELNHGAIGLEYMSHWIEPYYFGLDQVVLEIIWISAFTIIVCLHSIHN